MWYYDEVEKNILEEKPYDWKKHFLFGLPEMFYFMLKFTFLFLVAHAIITSLATVLIQELPTFCDKLL